jgi:gliding motility-associated lipoprotein GldH
VKNNVQFLVVLLISLASCKTRTDVFEKNIAIPERAWQNQFKPEISFQVSDTMARYNIYVVVRHTNAYQYNNLWVNIYTQAPGDSAMNKQNLDLRLATDDKGWLGSGMDDIFEHRIQITKEPATLKAGTYRFRLENIMRIDPLPEIMNMGIRVEKAR